MARTNTSKVKILEGAAECFAQKGYFSTSVDEIAARAGVAKGSIYYNFKSKEAILYGVIEWGLDIIDRETQKIVLSSSDEKSVLYKLLALYADLVLDYPELASVIFTSRIDHLSPEWRHKIKELTDMAITYVANLLKEGADSGFLKKMDYPLAAAGMFGMIWHSCDYFMKYKKNAPRKELYSVLFDTFCNGIVKKERI
jgi:AcrR family transcriptional regulator